MGGFDRHINMVAMVRNGNRAIFNFDQWYLSRCLTVLVFVGENIHSVCFS